MSDDSARPPEAEFREYTRGNLPKQEEPEVHPWTGIIDDPRVRTHLDYLNRIYDPEPWMEDDFEDTWYCEHVMKKYGTESGTRSLQTGNVGHLNFFSGLVGYEKDVSGMQVLMSLMNNIENTPVWITYIWGDMGSGKTNFGFLLSEVFDSVYDDVMRVANVDAEQFDETITRYSRLVELLEDRKTRRQDGEDLNELLVVIDEAAQIFTGSGADQHRAKQLAKVLKLARRGGANIIMIGQDGKDIDASLRALTNIFIHKTGETSATLYKDVANREGVHEIQSLSKIPETSIVHSTWDEGDFVFDDEGEDDLPTQEELDELVRQHNKEMMAILNATRGEHEMTQAEIADLYGYQDGKAVRRAAKKYDEQLRGMGLID